jgi:subtilisin family serine protease
MDVAKLLRQLRFGIISVLAVGSLTGCGADTAPASTVFPKTTAACSSQAVANQYVVRWKDGTTVVYKGSTREELLATVIEPNINKIEFAEQDQKVSQPKVPPRVQTEAVIPANDWGQQIVDAQIAWDQGYTGQGVVVAVIDSGVQRDHDQLKNQMFINAGEVGTDHNGNNKSNNGFDDDSNGYVDDVSGYDFNLNSATVTDGTGHGTHVAGIIGAQHSAGPVHGIAEGAKILPLDFMDDNGSGNISDAIRAMYYAAQMGAKVVNASWGGAPCSQNLQKAITDLGAQGVLFVSAAGNNGESLDTNPEYPAAYGLSTQVTVGASTARDYMSAYSNFSYTLANIMAPGDSIISTYPGNTTKSLSGTSMATPFVTGAAAILKGARPNASPSDIKNALLNSVDSGPFEVSSRGRLNVGKALTEILKLPQ